MSRGRDGMGTIAFDTEASATAAQATLQENRPPDAPQLTRSGIWEVMGQA